MRRFAECVQAPADIPWPTWLACAATAVVGSMIFGASLAVAIPGFSFKGSALWLTVSAGLSWPILGLAIILLSRAPLLDAMHACLIAMTLGEFVLVSGALVNLALYGTGLLTTGGSVINLVIVGCSNVVMAAVLAIQLRAIGVSVWRTIALWIVFLDGSGAVFFFVLRGWTEAGA